LTNQHIMEQRKYFKILSIDGGGIRGVFPAMFLANLEAELKARNQKNWQIYQQFDLICGTSTGGIIAIALALGIPAKEIYELYINNASLIFGDKKNFLARFKHSAYSQAALETILREKFKKDNSDQDSRLIDCKTNIAIPIYDLMEGRPSVLKSRYHEAFVRDFHIPAYMAALATSAAPTYFDPFSSNYVDLKGLEQPFQNKVDGGVFANNPTLNGIIEAEKAFDLRLSDLSILSIGTGHQRFCDAGYNKRNLRNKYGLNYWILRGNKKRLIEVFMQGQSQQVQNLISILKNGIDRRESDNFVYTRIDTELDESCLIEMDETDGNKLKKLAEKATIEFQNNATSVIKNYCDGFRWNENQGEVHQ
jgi:hypothetical protein